MYMDYIKNQMDTSPKRLLTTTHYINVLMHITVQLLFTFYSQTHGF